jgi:hypothetical protein
MSDKKIPLADIYDLSKNVKNVEINTGFILGLERLLLFFITEVIEDKTTIKPMFEKFEKLLTTQKPEEVPFTEMEANVYTLFALQQLFRSLAFEQNLVKKSETTISENEAKDLFKAYLEKDPEKVKEFLSKLSNEGLSR